MGYTTSRICIYESRLPQEADPAAVREKLQAAGERVMAVNANVLSIDTYTTGDAVTLLMGFRGRDQWWIRRKAPHVAMAILVQSGLDIRATHLVDILKPEHVPPRP